ncbi:MAG: polysaccharide deacetylase family protein [Actinomycetota bacterium]|jgi:peptidoglycan/xylan/chitin deacetylase (PgdA/CDA1 family)|nr:polysaccharide deacetylase family protein [Actinomycetota bacterium]MDQ3320047.1 polysaccharide deacetylase family protein [Actinomycetota bacterium]
MPTPPPPSVALTFDDGPDPVWTLRVLEALEAASVRATFFVIAPRSAAHPDVVEELLAAGHDVELHCHRHLRHPDTPRGEIERDTDAALAALGCLGIRPQRWRVPWGMEAPWTREVAAARGLELEGWSIDTHDWRGDPAAGMLAAARPYLEPGAVVLMHDGLGPGARRGGCEETVALVPALAEAIRERGLEPGPLSTPSPAEAA